ncbi:Mechanosensitive ion channel-domain-containing protein [Infundibulicybe gibba]|nr:Mechanosensitive ion channel-domain-containing protein [Infundibulicybe gibba]
MPNTDDITQEKGGLHDPELDIVLPRPDETDSKPTRKPTVHYQDSPTHPAAPAYHARYDSGDLLSSRPPSIAGTDDEDEPEDYDWSGEEDLVDEEAKFEERMGVKQKPQGWGPKRILTILFSTLIGSTFLAGVLVTPGVLIHFYWYLPSPSPQRLYIKQNVQAWLFWAAANILISWYLAMIIDIIPVISRFAIAGFWGHVSEYVKSRIEMYDTVKNTVKPLFYAGSCWLSWVIIFENIYHLFNSDQPQLSRARYTARVDQAIEFLFFLALVLCARNMLSHAIAFSFHRTAYQDRLVSLQESLSAIETLREYRPKISAPRPKSGARTPVFGGFTPFSEKEHFNFLSGALRSATPPGRRHRGTRSQDGDDGDTEEDGEKTVVGSKKSTMNGKGKEKKRASWLHGQGVDEGMDSNTSSPVRGKEVYDSPQPRAATPSGLLSNSSSPHRYPPSPNVGAETTGADATLVQAAKVLKSAVLHDARNIQGKTNDLVAMTWNVNSAHEAKRLARSIYMRLKNPRRTFLIPSDFHPAFPTPELAESAFRVFDKDNNGDLSRAEIKTTLLKVYKERRFLSRSMRDVGAALRTLDHILLLFAFVVLFFISLSVFGVEVGSSLTSVYSIGIAASFIFKNSASQAFDAIMFLFVTHPYDTGDRCFIDQEVLVVKKMGLFATVFTRGDGTETYYFNSQLFSKFITNVRRSGKMFENLTMQVAWRTPLEKLDALEKCLNEWLSTEENRWYEPSTSVTLQHIDYQRYLEITIGIGHNGKYYKTDWGLRNARKTAFHAAVQYFCRQLDIVGYESPMPIAYCDPAAQSYQPSPPASPAVHEPDGENTRNVKSEQEAEREAKEMKPSLGFLPPLATRESHLRARKSKGKKAMMRGLD